MKERKPEVSKPTSKISQAPFRLIAPAAAVAILEITNFFVPRHAFATQTVPNQQYDCVKPGDPDSEVIVYTPQQKKTYEDLGYDCARVKK